MAGPQRPTSGLPTRRTTTTRTTAQPTTRRMSSAVPEKRSLKSPAISSRASTATSRAIKSPSEPASITAKKRERDYEREINEDTSIHVVVRCRGRNDRELKENSGVVVSTEGVKGKNVELSMGPNALSDKTYTFDKVFSAAADQVTVYEDIVLPIVNEMLAGYNCTIFAYGQTGTGKTYTMSGDMTDTLGILSDHAGIIPRVFYSLFNKLEETESTVKCSFIELYNEELRDLLSAEENPKLKIFENESKKGQNSSTLVQGMEETFIHSATSGIELLQLGSHKRQVAATKCNDLSSRSHTVFTITVQTKRTSESGEEYISSGKLNLVDLAGSENIQRSGAENKRAAEAGLINKSLLTLGRVINALVDKSPHIPYRESKLTRLLQDSLGGRTKTCIIATVSPSRSNLEETISTLDYAFRAKNIRNKPQINYMSKKTLLREFTLEIEKLKGELIATRHRNGVYMTPDAYENLTMENDSRRIVNEEQRAKIESMEGNLRHKVQELFTLTSNFNNLKKDNEETRVSLQETNDLLEQTEIVLKDTKTLLEEEEMLRKAHQDTEEKLYDAGTGLLSTLDSTVGDVDGLHAKLQRKADLETANMETWNTSTSEVSQVTQRVDMSVENFQTHHSQLLKNMAEKINGFVANELSNIEQNGTDLLERTSSFETAEAEARSQTHGAHDEMNEVLEEIKDLREDVKSKVGEGLNGLSAAAARISKEVIGEFTDFHAQLHASYSTLGQEFKAMFENMVAHLNGQKTEINRLRLEIQEANLRTVDANRRASSHLAHTLEEEQATAEAERDVLLSQIRTLIEDSRQRQHGRLKGKVEDVRKEIASSGDNLEHITTHYDRQVDEWVFKSEQFAKDVNASRDEIKTKMQNDWEDFDQRNLSIQKATESVHEETVRIVNAQMNNMDKQMEALDDFVDKARSQNGQYRDAHIISLENMASNVHDSYSSMHDQISGLGDRVNQLQQDATQQHIDLEESTAPLSEEVRKPLQTLRTNILQRPLEDYVPTGATPQKRQYEFPSELPRTEPHDILRSRMRTSKDLTVLPFNDEEQLSPDSSPETSSPTKGFVYNDAADEVGTQPSATAIVTPSNTGLREVDANVAKPRVSSIDENSPNNPPSGKRKSSSLNTDGSDIDDLDEQQPAKRRRSSHALEAKLPHKMISKQMAGMMEGRENVPPPGLSGGRRLRGSPST